MNRIRRVDRLHFRLFVYKSVPVNVIVYLMVESDVPDEKSPVWIDDTDPSFIYRVGDDIEDSWVRVETFNRDLFKLKAFSPLYDQ